MSDLQKYVIQTQLHFLWNRTMILKTHHIYTLYPRPTTLEGVYWIYVVRRPSVCRRHGFRCVSQGFFGTSIWNFMCILIVGIDRSLLILSDAIFKWPHGGLIGSFGIRNLTLVWLWISTSNLSSTIRVYIGRRLLIFSDITIEMTAWRPCWIISIPDSNFSLALNINFNIQ